MRAVLFSCDLQKNRVLLFDHNDKYEIKFTVTSRIQPTRRRTKDCEASTAKQSAKSAGTGTTHRLASSAPTTRNLTLYCLGNTLFALLLEIILLS